MLGHSEAPPFPCAPHTIIRFLSFSRVSWWWFVWCHLQLTGFSRTGVSLGLCLSLCLEHGGISLLLLTFTSQQRLGVSGWPQQGGLPGQVQPQLWPEQNYTWVGEDEELPRMCFGLQPPPRRLCRALLASWWMCCLGTRARGWGPWESSPTKGHKGIAQPHVSGPKVVAVRRGWIMVQ